MAIDENSSSAEIFAEYHRGNRGRAIGPILVVAAIVVVIGGFVGGLSLLTQSQTSAEAGTSGLAPEGPLTVDNFVEITSAASQAAATGHVSMSITSAGTTVTLDGDFKNGATLAESQAVYTIQLTADSTLEMRIVDNVIYANYGAQTENKFVALDLNDASNPLAAQLKPLVDQSNSFQTSQLQDAIASVEVDGEPEAIDGIEATPYRVVVKTAALASVLELSAEAKAALPEEYTYRYLIGPDSLIRKVTFEVAGVTQEITLSKWGETVTITAPTADEIVSVPAT